MPMAWRDLARVYGPILALVLINIVGGIYAFGFESGKRVLLDASARSASEAKNG